MIAFHFPPYAGGTGVHRTLKFSRYLPEFGWEPIVLTANPRAYPKVDASAPIPDRVRVERVFALDTARHLAIAGRHLHWMALPDRWVSWWPGAVLRGLSLIKRYRPHVIWSTYPIATAHAIGIALHKSSQLPWVADFRDPMTNVEQPGVSSTAALSIEGSRARIERRAIQACSRAVFTTQGTAASYSARFPEVPRDHWSVIPNGFDEEDFDGSAERPVDGRKKPFVLLHSGDLYRGTNSGRDPTSFFKALAILKSSGRISADELRVVLRATSDDAHFQALAKTFSIDDVVSIERPISHKEAVREMLQAHGLLLLQGSKFNRQIPAKVYEYLRCGRPILALTDSAGDTAALLRSEGIVAMASPDSPEDIAARLLDFISFVEGAGGGSVRDFSVHSRRARTRELAGVLDAVAKW